MANTARLYNFPEPDSGNKERRVVDTDNGFTRIANELLEAVIGAGLTQNQLLITLAVIRKTYGYNKTSDWVGNSQLSELTGLPETRCSTERNKLIKMNVLTVTGRLIGVNKEVSSWNTKFYRNSEPIITESVNITDSVKFTESVKETFTESVNHGLQNLLNTKDNSTKENKDNNNITPVVLTTVDSPPSEKPKKRATQFPSDFTTTEGNLRLANELGVDLQSEVQAFADHHQSKGSTFKDWNLALNTWLRNAVKFGRKSAPNHRQQAGRSQPDNFSSKDYGTTQMPSWAQE